MERTKETLEARVRETPLVDRLKECQQRIGNMCAELRGPKMSIPVEYYDDDFYICTTLADAQATVEALQAQLPAEMQGCTILFKECEKGHGRLVATNWRDHGCQTCEVEALQRELESANALLHKKNCAIGKAETTIEALQRERDALKLVNEMHMKTVMELSHIVEQSGAALDAEREKVRDGETAYKKLSEQWNAVDLKLSQLQALVRAYGEAKVAFDGGRLREDHHAWKERFERLTTAEQALIVTLDATTPARFTKEELTKWWRAQCPQCGWDGLSRDCAGGEPIADTGDYADPICPMCDQTGRCVVVDDYVEPTGGDGE